MWRERRPDHVPSVHVPSIVAKPQPLLALHEPLPGEHHVPQRLQSVCVLLWRFPKLEVPFAVSRLVSMFGERWSA